MKRRYLKICHQQSTAAGFTLVELLVSAGILGIVVGGILISYVRCMELNEASQNKSLASKAARSQMELIRSSDYDTMVANYHGVIFNVDGFVGKGVSYVTVLDAKNTTIVVSVSWKQKNGRVYGEDKNLNGVLDGGEDLNGDGMLNSPVDVITRVYKRS